MFGTRVANIFGNMTSMSDGNGDKVLYEYNENNLKVLEKYAGTVVEYTYN